MTPRIMAEGKTPDKWVEELGKAGITVSERTLRERARRLGACRMLGNAMILLPEHIDQIFGVEPEATPDAAAVLAIIKRAVIRVSPDDGLAFDIYVESPDDGSVYFLSDGERIKIGFAMDVWRRIDSIRAGSSRPLDLLAVVPGGRSFENYLHTIFSDLRRHGEWFDVAGPIEAMVSEMRGLR